MLLHSPPLSRTVSRMSSQDILVARKSGVATVTLNRPEKRNAVRFAMWKELARLFGEFGDDGTVRAVILTGAGGHFSAGADISEFGDVRDNAAGAAEYEHAGDAAMMAIRDCPKPVIAHIQGVCVGGALGLALCCDFRIADETARLGIPAARLGIVYSALETQLLMAAAGAAGAKRVLMTGRIFTVAEAARLHLVDEIATDAASVVRDLAATLAANAPLSVAGAKYIINAIAGGLVAERGAEMSALVTMALDSADYLEGRRAFMEKRAPRFEGR
jgi:enoyl-CoA hydratase/carnithine racemase